MCVMTKIELEGLYREAQHRSGCKYKDPLAFALFDTEYKYPTYCETREEHQKVLDALLNGYMHLVHLRHRKNKAWKSYNDF